jgi:hypothetical protein
MVGDRVLKQQDVQPGTRARDSAGVASWFVDCHDVQRYASGPPPHGVVLTEGCMNAEANATSNESSCVTTGHWWPKPFYAYEVPLWVVLPPEGEARNLLVPVAVSASHVAFQTVRLEPTWSVLGQAAGVVAALALASSSAAVVVDVHAVNVSEVQRVLVEQGAVVFLQ